MASAKELMTASMSRYESGDIEGAKRLYTEMKATETSEEKMRQSISAYKNGDIDSAKALYRESNDIITPFQESRFTDIGRGIKAAPVTVAQGISEAAALALDYSMGTEYSRPVTEAFEKFKSENDLDPRGVAGHVTEEILAFGLGFIPIAGWVGRASSVARGTAKTKATSRFFKSAEKFGADPRGKKLLDTRAKLIGATAIAATGYETLVTPDGRATLSDAFDAMPDALKTEDTSGLEGSEFLKARAKNRFKRGLEGGLFSLGVDVGLPLVTQGVRVAGSLPGINIATAGVAQGTSKVFQVGTNLLGRLPGANTANRKFTQWFKPASVDSSAFVEEVLDVKAVGDSGLKEGMDSYRQWEKASGEFLKYAKISKFKSSKSRKELRNKLFRYMQSGDESVLDGLNVSAKKAANNMIKLNHEYQDRVIKELEDAIRNPTDISTLEQTKAALEMMKKNRFTDEINPLTGERDISAPGAYLRQRFDLYEDKNYWTKFDFKSEPYKKALAESKAYVRLNEPTATASGTERLSELFSTTDMPEFVEDAATGVMRLSSDDLDRYAERMLLKTLNLDIAKGLTSPAQALAQNKMVMSGIDRNFKPGKAINLADGIFIPRKDAIQELPAVRVLMGELTEPEQAFTSTISDLARTAASMKFYRGVAADEASGGFSVNVLTALNRLSSDEVNLPMIVRNPNEFTPEQLKASLEDGAFPLGADNNAVLDVESVLASRGYTKLEPEMVPDPRDGMEGRGVLAMEAEQPFQTLSSQSMWVSPAAKDALTTPARMGLDELGEVFATAAVLKGEAQRMTIVPNILSQIRNISGNVLAIAQNGNLKRDSDFIDTFRLIANNVDNMDDAALRKFSGELGALGVMDTSLVTSALNNMKSAAKEFSTSGSLAKFIETTTSAIPFMRQLESMYSESDSFFKLMSVFAEQGKVVNALGKAGMDIDNLPSGALDALVKNFIEQGIAKRGASLSMDQSPSNFLLTMAGDTVKDTMPVYTRVGKMIKKLDALPVLGAFTSFASENIRNSANTLSRGISEMGFVASDELIAALGTGGRAKAKALERQIRGIGAQRLTSYLAVSQVLPAAITKASMTATGTTEEEYNAARVLTPEFYNGSELLVIDNDKRGKITLGNQSNIFPHSFVTDPARAALRQYSKAGSLGKGEAEQILSGAWAGVKGYAEPFLQESLMYEKVRDAMPQSWLGRGGETQTGSKVWRESDSFGTKLSKASVHIGGTFLPGYIRMGVESRGGTFVEGRLGRALFDLPGARGQTYTGEEELARTLSGITPIVVNTRTDFGFAGGEYNPLRSSAKGQATATMKRADATVPEMLDSWNTYLDDLFRVQSDLFYKVEAARAIGTSDTVIRKQLKAAKVGTAELNSIMRGEFWPGLASQETIKSIRIDMRNPDKKRLVEDIPFFEFNRLSNQRRRIKLSPETAKQERLMRLADRQAQRQAEVDAAAAAAAAPPQTFVEQLSNTATGVVDTITDTASNVANTVTDTASNVSNTVTDTASNVAGAVSNAATNVGDATGNFRQRAQVLAPSVFGDPANREIINQQANQ